MKSIKFLFLGLLIIPFCISCHQRDRSKVQFYEVNYIIPDTLLNFFDEYFNEELKPLIHITNAGGTELPYYATEFAVTFIVEVYFCKDTVWLAKLEEDFKKNGALRIKSDEDDYFVIGSERYLLNSYDTVELSKRYRNLFDKPLVPYFHGIFKDDSEYYEKSTISGLPFDYEIIIVGSGNEYVLPEKYKVEWSILPEEIRHGYSYGIAFSKSDFSIIYWIVAW